MAKRLAIVYVKVKRMFQSLIAVNCQTAFVTSKKGNAIDLKIEAKIVKNVCVCVHLNLNRYSRINGFCNNLKHPNIGIPNIPYERMLNAVYEDGKFNPK